MAKRVEVTVAFDLAEMYQWPEISARALLLYEYAKENLDPLTGVDIVSIEVTQDAGELEEDET